MGFLPERGSCWKKLQPKIVVLISEGIKMVALYCLEIWSPSARKATLMLQIAYQPMSSRIKIS